MARQTDSFKQFHYGLRQSKQVERRIMIEVLLRLAKAGLDISEYAYLGFGSVYYVDFIMFHKHLYIKDMVCIEWSDVEQRMKFNKPFKFIKLRIGSLSDQIPNIAKHKRYLAWLDYDRSLDNEILLDVDGCISRLSPGSVFVVTVDARPKLPTGVVDLHDKPPQEISRSTLDFYRTWFERYTANRLSLEDISRKEVASLFYEILVSRITQSLRQRDSRLSFFQIFNYFYSDGAPMLTLGGIICTPSDLERIEQSKMAEHRFIRSNADRLVISVPHLTVREKQWLDSNLDSKMTVEKLPFELDPELLENYVKFYKEYPTYTESVL